MPPRELSSLWLSEEPVKWTRLLQLLNEWSLKFKNEWWASPPLPSFVQQYDSKPTGIDPVRAGVRSEELKYPLNKVAGIGFQWIQLMNRQGCWIILLTYDWTNSIWSAEVMILSIWVVLGHIIALCFYSQRRCGDKPWCLIERFVNFRMNDLPTTLLL